MSSSMQPWCRVENATSSILSVIHITVGYRRFPYLLTYCTAAPPCFSLKPGCNLASGFRHYSTGVLRSTMTMTQVHSMLQTTSDSRGIITFIRRVPCGKLECQPAPNRSLSATRKTKHSPIVSHRDLETSALTKVGESGDSVQQQHPARFNGLLFHVCGERRNCEMPLAF